MGFVPSGKVLALSDPWDQDDGESGKVHERTLDHFARSSAREFQAASEKPGHPIVNPLLELLCERMESKEDHNDDYFTILKPAIRKLRMGLQSSWNKISLTQPPLKDFTLFWVCECCDDEFWDQAEDVVDEMGTFATVGDLLDKLYWPCDVEGDGFVAFRWA